MFGLEWQGKVMKQRRPGGIWRTWMRSQRQWLYWLPPFDDDLRPDTVEAEMKRIQRHWNALVALS